jgi:hypothetical protein
MIENIITLVLIVSGIGAVWVCGYLKGRWDAGVSIGKRYDVKPKLTN